MIGGAQNSVNRRLSMGRIFRGAVTGLSSVRLAMAPEADGPAPASRGGSPFHPLDDIHLEATQILLGGQAHRAGQPLAGIADRAAEERRYAQPDDQSVESALTA